MKDNIQILVLINGRHFFFYVECDYFCTPNGGNPPTSINFKINIRDNIQFLFLIDGFKKKRKQLYSM